MLLNDYVNECAMREQTSQGGVQAFGADAVLCLRVLPFFDFALLGIKL